MAQVILAVVTHLVMPIAGLGALVLRPTHSRVSWVALALAMLGLAAIMYAGAPNGRC